MRLHECDNVTCAESSCKHPEFPCIPAASLREWDGGTKPFDGRHKYHKLPRSTAIQTEVLSDWKNTPCLCSNKAVLKRCAEFNLATSMLHLIWQRLLLLQIMLANVTSSFYQ